MKQIAVRLLALLLAAAVVTDCGFAAEKAAADKVGAEQIKADRPQNPFDAPMIFVIVRSNAGYCEP